MALILTGGVFIFNLGDSKKANMISEISGYILGLFSLFCDGIVSHF